MEAARVLVIEDDASLRRAVARGLSGHGMSVSTAGDGGSALAAIDDVQSAFDVIVLDIGLPDSDGRDVCQAIRARGIHTPVLFLTARAQVGDVLSGFSAGGDDYLSKPFHVAELLARVTALARRREPTPVVRAAQPGHPTQRPHTTEPREAEKTHLDPRTHSLVSSSCTHSLTPTEYRLLAALMGSPGHVLRRRELISAAWPAGAIVSDNTLDQYIARLRRKLSQANETRAIVTAHGVGYRFT